MAELSEPFDGGPVMNDAGWTDLWSATLTSGVVPTPINALQVYTDQDGRQVKVRPGRGVMRGHRYISDSTKAIPLATNISGTTRTDVVVLRLNTLAKKITTEVVQGAPGRAALTRQDGGVWEEPLASISVPSGFTTITPTQVTDERAYAMPQRPVGEIILWAASNPPVGWLRCEGQALRRDSYANLFSIIGTTWGIGDGSTTFNVPDFRDRVPRGMSTGTPLGSAGGSDAFTLTTGQMPVHSHTVNDPGHKHRIDGDPGDRLIVTATNTTPALVNDGTGQEVAYTDIDPATTGITLANAGGGQAVTHVPRYRGVPYIIKY